MIKKAKNKWIITLVLCMVLACLCAGCGSSSNADPGEGTAQETAITQNAASETEETGLDTPSTTEFNEWTSSEEADPTEADSWQSDGLPDRNGVYDSKEDVALYLHTYGELPSNYITKREARSLGWKGGSLEDYAPGKCIGGDVFGNYEKRLPEDTYHECDIDTLGAGSRGPERLVYSDDEIYYTGDHYRSFVQLYDADGPTDRSD